MADYLSEAYQQFDYTQSLRRDLHQFPELGFQEVRTASIVARELQNLALEVTTGIAQTGVMALLEGAQPGPVALLRFDMDALPIQEATNAPYASQHPGVMHACGHDGHVAIGLTVARLLHAHRQELAGTVKLIFQPAEEGLGGAVRMIAEGVLQNPHPDFSLGVHLWNEKPIGWFGIAEGPVMAGAERFQLKITGKGGHGAMPHIAIDPILAAAQVITTLQSIVSRNVSPLQAAVVSVTSVHGGDAFNIIPTSISLQGTIRTFEPEVRQTVLQRFQHIVEGVVQSMGCQVEIDLQPLTSAVINDPQVTRRVRALAAELFPDSSITDRLSTMGSEDMSIFLQEAPGCFIFVGSANPQKDLDAPHHHPRFDFDEDALPRAAALLAHITADFLSSGI